MKKFLLIGLFMATTLISGTLQAAKNNGRPGLILLFLFRRMNMLRPDAHAHHPGRNAAQYGKRF